MCRTVATLVCAGLTLFRAGADTIDYPAEMRVFVQGISAYAKSINPNFIVVVQNGVDLLTSNGEPDGPVATAYTDAIDGQGQEHPFYGETRYDRPTKPADSDYYVAFLDRAESLGIEVLATDYCWTPAYVDHARARATAHGYLSFAAYGSDYDLDNIPPYPVHLYGENADVISTLSDAKNFLYLIDPDAYHSRWKFIYSIKKTKYDLLITDAYYNERALKPKHLARLKHKKKGGTRLVLAYVNIGAAEMWRYYWQSGWTQDNPAFLADKYEGYPDERWVRYWQTEWQDIIFGNDGSYIKRAIDAGFDGIYLDNLLAYEHFAKTNRN